MPLNSMNRQSPVDMILDLIRRFKLAAQVLVAPSSVVSSSVGQMITYNSKTRRLEITGDFEIHATGNLYLSSDQNIILHSGNSDGEYTHQIHLNPDLEEDYVIYVDQQGSSREWDLQSQDRLESLSFAADNGNSGFCGQHQPTGATQSTTGGS